MTRRTCPVCGSWDHTDIECPVRELATGEPAWLDDDDDPTEGDDE